MPETDPREPYQITMLQPGTRVTGPGLEKWANDAHPKEDRPASESYKHSVQVQLPGGRLMTAHGAWPQRAPGGGFYLFWDAVQ